MAEIKKALDTSGHIPQQEVPNSLAADPIAAAFELPNHPVSTNQEWNRYMFDSVLPNTSPLCWWKERAHTYPGLAPLMASCLCIPATSAAAERSFSTAALVVSKKRARMNATLVDQLVFLNKC